MMKFFKNMKHLFSEMWHKSSGISIHAVHRNRLIYTFAYAFELILFACVQFMSPGKELLGLSNQTILYVTHMLASLIVMLLWSDKFKPLIYVSVIVMLIGFVGYVFLPDGYLRLIAAVFAMSGLGGAVTSARCGFAFTASNAERLIGMTVMFFGVAGIYYLSRTDIGVTLITTVIPLVLMSLLAICLMLFKEEDFEVVKKSNKTDAKGLYWALAFFIIYFAIDGYIWRFIDNTSDDFIYTIMGMVITGVIFFILLLIFKLNVWHIWNLFFLFAVIMSIFIVLGPQIGSAAPHYFFSGLSLIGWPLSIYMLACAQRRFASYALLKRCTLIYVLLAPVTTISDDIFKALVPETMHIITLVYILITVFVLLALSPYSYKYLFSTRWISDLRKSDMEKILEKLEEVDRFKDYNLTPRQREVAALLLAAQTRRQISGELGLSESTVKMHTTELYRRLNISSKAELFKIFGVADVTAAKESKELRE